MNAMIRAAERTICAAVLACSTTHAATVFLSGDTTGALIFQRPVEDLSALSAIGTAAHYISFSFTALTSGAYTFTTSGVFDTFVLLYGAPFDPATPLLYALIANDDLSGAAFNVSGLSFGLQAGRPYTYVVTGFDNSEFGAYTTTIESPSVAVIPEPASWALLAVGLLAGTGWRHAAARKAVGGDRS